jgi:hypothetical protein
VTPYHHANPILDFGSFGGVYPEQRRRTQDRF